MPAPRSPMLPAWRHVLAMSDAIGIFEHADRSEPRRDEGYCTDDMARLLIAIVREPDRRPRAATSSPGSASASSSTPRASPDAFATGAVSTAAGTAGEVSRTAGGAASGRSAPLPTSLPTSRCARGAMSYFGHAVGQRSPHRRAMAFAALGAAEVLAVEPRHSARAAAARRRRRDDRTVGDDPSWPWPEHRLSYANAVIAEALIVAGASASGVGDVLADGLTLLRWLLERQIVDGHLSPTPVGGAGRADRRPAVRPATDRGRGAGRRVRPRRRR